MVLMRFCIKYAKNMLLEKKSRLLERRKGHKTARNQFWIQHFADVKYDIDGFLDKNKDELGKNLDDVVKTSSVNLVKTHLFPPETEDSSKPAKRRFGGRREW